MSRESSSLDGLNARQRAALNVLQRNPLDAAGAKWAGISRRTLGELVRMGRVELVGEVYRRRKGKYRAPFIQKTV